MRSLIAYATMAIKNWKVTGSIGGTQVLTLLRHFPACFSAQIMREFSAMNFWTQRAIGLLEGLADPAPRVQANGTMAATEQDADQNTAS